MTNRFISHGNGYADDKSFADFEVVAAPLPGYSPEQREARVFGRDDGRPGTGTDYGSHTVALAVYKTLGTFKGTRQLYLLIRHGGGSEVWSLPTFYDRGDFERALLAMPERIQYATLYTLYHAMSDARREVLDSEANRWKLAIIENRVKKGRPKRGRYNVRITDKQTAAQVQP